MVSQRFSVKAALALLAGQAIAQPINHHVHAREAEPVNVYVTIQETHYVTVGHQVAPTSVAQVASTFTYDASATYVAPTTSVEAAPAAATTSSPSVAAVKETSSSVAAAASASSASSSSSSSSAALGSAGALGITYSPYTAAGQCKTSSEVAADLAKLTGFNLIRLYGTDCSQVANVYNNLADGQKLFLGVYDTGNIASSVAEMAAGINYDWSVVHTVSIGNELVNAGTASVSQVAGFVAEGRSALTAAGYTGPVVTVDTFIATINNPSLCDVSDYIAVNAHAFFDGNIAAADAGTWALQQIQRVYTACGGTKDVIITESGWPSAGETNGLAIPSPENQAAAVASLKATIGDACFLFTAFNDYWKNPGAFAAEQYWGIYGDASA